MRLAAILRAVLITGISFSVSAAANAGRDLQDIDPTTLQNIALEAAKKIDAENYSQLWDSASSATKKSLTKDKFISQVKQNRRAFNHPSLRRWSSLTQINVQKTSGNLQPGRYANVRFQTQFPDNLWANELVSFRHDEDGKWRFSGYVLSH